ncbi:MAG: hypothetical protein UW12_C0043G0001, partial [Parcubacteria group bacterium GW2011_GWF1_43_9]
RRIKYFPGLREEPKAVKNQDIAGNMERTKVRIAAPAEEVLQQVAHIMGVNIHAGESG